MGDESWKSESYMATFLQVCFLGFFNLLSLFMANSFINMEQETTHQHLLIKHEAPFQIRKYRVIAIQA